MANEKKKKGIYKKTTADGVAVAVGMEDIRCERRKERMRIKLEKHKERMRLKIEELKKALEKDIIAADAMCDVPYSKLNWSGKRAQRHKRWMVRMRREEIKRLLNDMEKLENAGIVKKKRWFVETNKAVTDDITYVNFNWIVKAVGLYVIWLYISILSKAYPIFTKDHVFYAMIPLLVIPLIISFSGKCTVEGYYWGFNFHIFRVYWKNCQRWETENLLGIYDVFGLTYEIPMGSGIGKSPTILRCLVSNFDKMAELISRNTQISNFKRLMFEDYVEKRKLRTGIKHKIIFPLLRFLIFASIITAMCAEKQYRWSRSKESEVSAEESEVFTEVSEVSAEESEVFTEALEVFTDTRDGQVYGFVTIGGKVKRYFLWGKSPPERKPTLRVVSRYPHCGGYPRNAPPKTYIF